MKLSAVLLPLLCLLFMYKADAQVKSTLLETLPIKDGLVLYENIVEVESTPKEELYQRAKRWVVNNYKSAKDVIHLDDPLNGEFIIKGTYKTLWRVTFMEVMEVYADHTLNISVKDGRYRYQLTDLVLSGYQRPNQYAVGGPWQKNIETWATFRPKNAKKYFEETLDPRIRSSLSNLINAMATPIPANQDW